MHDYKSKVFNLCALEFTFVMSQEEVVFTKSLQDQTCNAMVLLHGFSLDEDVVEVHADNSLHNKVLKDLIHHFLEGRRTVCKAKEHHQWFEQPTTCLKHSLPLITFLHCQHTGWAHQGIHLEYWIGPPLDRGGGLPDKCESSLHWPYKPYIPVRLHFASATSGGTATHLHLTHGPVDFRVALPKPTKPQYHLALPQSCDCKLGLLGVIVELHDDINNITNCTLLIGGTVHIVHRNSLC